MSCGLPSHVYDGLRHEFPRPYVIGRATGAVGIGDVDGGVRGICGARVDLRRAGLEAKVPRGIVHVLKLARVGGLRDTGCAADVAVAGGEVVDRAACFDRFGAVACEEATVLDGDSAGGS